MRIFFLSSLHNAHFLTTSFWIERAISTSGICPLINCFAKQCICSNWQRCICVSFDKIFINNLQFSKYSYFKFYSENLNGHQFYRLFFRKVKYSWPFLDRIHLCQEKPVLILKIQKNTIAQKVKYVVFSLLIISLMLNNHVLKLQKDLI